MHVISFPKEDIKTHLASTNFYQDPSNQLGYHNKFVFKRKSEMGPKEKAMYETNTPMAIYSRLYIQENPQKYQTCYPLNFSMSV